MCCSRYSLPPLMLFFKVSSSTASPNKGYKWSGGFNIYCEVDSLAGVYEIRLHFPIERDRARSTILTAESGGDVLDASDEKEIDDTVSSSLPPLFDGVVDDQRNTEEANDSLSGTP
ncbi:hypothetical protein AVEN_236901-1 [Araneus ventricosus]|uniref:Uncharacterized protein n=1 Tax=Araneus ventricosus TaxID=182803 RepID=A0A4Y2DQF8_ARAVE|nr:hypothetical protein AVEN_236901-1 [Araneus ventricosus]